MPLGITHFAFMVGIQFGVSFSKEVDNGKICDVRVCVSETTERRVNGRYIGKKVYKVNLSSLLTIFKTTSYVYRILVGCAEYRG